MTQLRSDCSVMLADPKAVKGMTGLRAKTDKIDARLLAQLLAAGFIAEVWTPDEQTRVRRRLISRRIQLVRQRVREKTSTSPGFVDTGALA
ncbi:MAG: IS110 family transposase [Solirubrobacteraceae bacterium]